MAEEQKSSWDLKQVGSGAGASAVLLFLMQSQGVSLINENQNAQNQVVIEKTVANSQRISRNERAISDMGSKIETGFSALRTQAQEQRDYIEKVIRLEMRDRFTRTDHESFEKSINNRFEKLEKDIEKLEMKIK